MLIVHPQSLFDALALRYFAPQVVVGPLEIERARHDGIFQLCLSAKNQVRDAHQQHQNQSGCHSGWPQFARHSGLPPAGRLSEQGPRAVLNRHGNRGGITETGRGAAQGLLLAVE